MSSERDKRFQGFKPAGDLIQQLFKEDNSALSQQFLRWKLWSHWPEVVGESLGKNTAPVGYYRRQLYVWVKNASWLQELSFVEPSLRDKINAYLGRAWVGKIRFTLDRKSVPTYAESDEAMRDFLSK